MFLRKVNNRLIQLTLSYGKVASVFSTLIHDNSFKRNIPEDLVEVALENIQVTRPQDWDKVKQFIFEHVLNWKHNICISPENIDGVIMASMSRLNRLDLAKCYLSYLEGKNIEPNLATLGRYLKLMYDNNKENISKTDENEILSICDDIQKRYPILESRTLENMVLAISLTKDWKKSAHILQEIKKTSNVSTLAYSAFIAAAFRNKEEELAWDLLKESLALDKTPLSLSFLSYLKTLKRQRKKENIIKNLEKMFVFLRDSEMHCPEEVVDDIVQSFNLGQKTAVKFSGHCENCNTKLEKLELTEAEFADLKDGILKNAIVGKDIFIKTNPAEMKQFQKFVANIGTFDVVLDGLNIAYSSGTQKGPHEFSKILCSVISHFVQQNKTILMLGRVHMTKWPSKNWSYIKQNASVFLTQNISQDDPYLLYCALHSGKDTIIVTRDLMRSHKFLLKERKYKILFDRWLSQRQYFLLSINNQGKVFFRVPPHFDAMAQKKENIWHIPFIPEADGTINETYHKTWLCLNCS